MSREDGSCAPRPLGKSAGGGVAGWAARSKEIEPRRRSPSCDQFCHKMDAKRTPPEGSVRSRYSPVARPDGIKWWCSWLRCGDVHGEGQGPLWPRRWGEPAVLVRAPKGATVDLPLLYRLFSTESTQKSHTIYLFMETTLWRHAERDWTLWAPAAGIRLVWEEHLRNLSVCATLMSADQTAKRSSPAGQPHAPFHRGRNLRLRRKCFTDSALPDTM